LIIDTLSLHWFRGAAEGIRLETATKSVAIYGPNGSGKSSIVDALEFLLTQGRIKHLEHEYSGKRLERSVPNIRTPVGVMPTVSLRLASGQEASACLPEAGKCRASGLAHLAGWDADVSILRQSDVAAFVHATKGDKFSTILPLLGLQPLETATQNLHQLRREVERASEVGWLRGEIQLASARINAAFPDNSVDTVRNAVRVLHRRYLPDAPEPTKLGEAVAATKEAISQIIGRQDAESRSHLVLKQLGNLQLGALLARATSASHVAADVAEPLIQERLGVLGQAAAFAARLSPGSMVACPACGQPVESGQLRTHVEGERIRFASALRLFDSRRAALDTLAAALRQAQNAAGGPELKELSASVASMPWADDLRRILSFDVSVLQGSNASAALDPIAEPCAKVTVALAAMGDGPPGIADLVADRDVLHSAEEWRRCRELGVRVAQVEAVFEFVEAMHAEARAEVKARTKEVIAGISGDVARMWATLHPGELITGIEIYHHPTEDKAVDIALSFHGDKQLSPRLTLSEGHRNSLGLCVFLALAARSSGTPIILDDVVTSFDREHRERVVDLLQAELASRQVILLTHEHDWFIELTRRLNGKQWAFRSLLPFSDPTLGIRWSDRPPGFEAARSLLDLDPAAAANKARGLMDQHGAILAEALRIPVPFLRGARNDLRTANDLLERFCGKASRLQRRDEAGKHRQWDEPERAAREVIRLLVPFANAASHGRYVTRGEAERLITACEIFLATLSCTSCADHVSTRQGSDGKSLDCGCGELRWTL
jgi:energy-coupling factor transporter ATP-binding protein EcfA2